MFLYLGFHAALLIHVIKIDLILIVYDEIIVAKTLSF